MNIFIIILSIALATGFLYLGYATFVVRSQTHKKGPMQCDCDSIGLSVNIAHAGSDRDCIPVSRKALMNLPAQTTFKDSEGRILNPSQYELYMVDGECMQYAYIYPNDLLFATRGFDVETYNGKLPLILILKKGSKKTGTQPYYKLRRLWKFCNYRDDLMGVIQSIIESHEFQEVRQRPNYDGDKALIDDFFKTRLPKYEENHIKCEYPNINDEKIVISTTFHTDIQSVRFSIHPISNVVGKVVAAFPVESKYITIEN